MLGVHAHGRHSGGLADGVLGCSNLGEAEVQNLGVAPLGNENVRRLDVTVNDAFRVRRIQRIRNVDCHMQEPLQFHRLTGDQMFQCRAIEVLHGNERPAFFLANLMNRADVGVIQCRSGPRLPPKTFKGLRVMSNIVGQEFQRHGAAQRCVLGFVNHTHPAPTQSFRNSVVRDRLPDQ